MIMKVKNITLNIISIPSLNVIVAPEEVIEVDSSVMPLEWFSEVKEIVEVKTKTNKSKK